MVSPPFARARQCLIVATALTFGASAAPGCKTSCDDAVDSTPKTFDGGMIDASGTSYQSAPWSGPFLEFPPSRVYEVRHHLRSTPFIVVPYVAFGSTGEAALAAGDLAPITDVNETSFRVTNTTCETFYLRVTAYAGDFAGSSAGGAAGLDENAGTGGAL